MFRYFDNPINKNIYKVGLFSIDEDALIYIDLSRKDNIYYMRDKFVKEIFVQETLSNNYVREIVTGMFIPVKKEKVSIGYIYSEVEGRCPLVKYYDPFNLPFAKTNSLTYVKRLKNVSEDLSSVNFIYVYDNIGFSSYSYIVKMKELVDYLEKHKDIENWKEELNNIFEEGERKYQNALDNKLISDNIKYNNKLIKKLRKR